MKSFALFILGVVLVIAIPVLAFAYVYDFGQPSGFYFGTEHQTASGSTVVSPYWAGITMLLGTLFGSIHERLRSLQGEVQILEVLRSTFRQAGVFRALIASPLLFSGVYIATRTAADPVLALAFAFQTGFFCEALLRKQVAELHLTQPTAPKTPRAPKAPKTKKAPDASPTDVN